MSLNSGSIIELASDHGEQLSICGIALEKLADLLGHDGCDHNFSEKDMYGLCCAVRAIGAAVRVSGFELCGQAERELQK